MIDLCTVLPILVSMLMVTAMMSDVLPLAKEAVIGGSGMGYEQRTRFGALGRDDLERFGRRGGANSTCLACIG